jgi:hypothetical protein
MLAWWPFLEVHLGTLEHFLRQRLDLLPARGKLRGKQPANGCLRLSREGGLESPHHHADDPVGIFDTLGLQAFPDRFQELLDLHPDHPFAADEAVQMLISLARDKVLRIK